MASFVNPYELLMMRQDARRDVLEAMFQNVVRTLVLNNDDPTRVPASTPLLQADIDRLPTADVETLAGTFASLLFVDEICTNHHSFKGVGNFKGINVFQSFSIF